MSFPEEACVAVIEGLDAMSIELFIHLFGSFGAPVIEHFENDFKLRSFLVAREQEGIGIASGLALAGKEGVLFYQDTGLGNSMGAFTAYTMAYFHPC